LKRSEPGPLLPELQRTKRRIWILIFGGALLFIATAMLLAAMNPTTPANQLVDRATIWLFAPSVVMVFYGAYVSMRDWRCPRCGLPLPTKFPVRQNCRRCGETLRTESVTARF
jgi:ABC-type uncharacterized transport system permease subunit